MPHGLFLITLKSMADKCTLTLTATQLENHSLQEVAVEDEVDSEAAVVVVVSMEAADEADSAAVDEADSAVMAVDEVDSVVMAEVEVDSEAAVVVLMEEEDEVASVEIEVVSEAAAVVSMVEEDEVDSVAEIEVVSEAAEAVSTEAVDEEALVVTVVCVAVDEVDFNVDSFNGILIDPKCRLRLSLCLDLLFKVFRISLLYYSHLWSVFYDTYNTVV